MAESILTGSICLSDIPKSQMKRVKCKDGQERIYLNIAVIARKTPQTFDNNGIKRTFTHFVSCSPKKEDRVEGENYIFGDLETRVFSSSAPTADEIASAPALSSSDQYPF